MSQVFELDLPDDVAAFLLQQSDVSAYVAEAIRQQMPADEDLECE